MIPSRAADELHMTILVALWSAALAVATTGTWLLFRAQPGVNWALVTLSASLALLGCARLRAGADTRDPRGRNARSAPPAFLMTVALALALAMGAALTADVVVHVVIAFAVSGARTTAPKR